MTNLEERRQLQADVDELLRSNQINVATMATTAQKFLKARNWKKAKSAVEAAKNLIVVNYTLNEVLVREKVCVSFAECRRLTENGGVKVNGSRPRAWNMKVPPGSVVHIGKDKTFTV